MIADKESAGRYRIERNDTNRVLYPKKAFGENFYPMPNEGIYNVCNAIFQKNTNIKLTQAISDNYGETLQVLGRVSDVNCYSAAKGIGDIQAYIILQFNVSAKYPKLALSYNQITCTNQLPSLRNDPLSKVLDIKNMTSISSHVGKLNQYVIKEVQSMLDLLNVLAEITISTKSAITLFSLAFGIHDIENEKPKLYDILMDKYDTADNASPGYLLGAINAVTNYFVDYEYKDNYSRTIANYPNSPASRIPKKALKICKDAIKFDNVDDYFSAII